MSTVTLTITEDQHSQLEAHLFPGDGLEAVAFLMCGRAAGVERQRLVVRSVHLVPHDRCERLPNRINWKADDIIDLIEQADVEGLSLIKVHSHPGGYDKFSEIDDESDGELLPTIRSWVEAEVPHGSVIMLPGGRMFGRYLWSGSDLHDLGLINVAGPTLRFWWSNDSSTAADLPFGSAQDQAFGEGTTRQLQRLRIAVIGASGTGSPVIEQLKRLGVGHLVLVDDDKIEDRNLNRILFATTIDVGETKVSTAKGDIERTGLGTRVTALESTLQNPQAVRAVSECDIIFGCVDTVRGRFVMNLLASYYLIPTFDIGVLLDAEQNGSNRGRIKDIIGTVHYLVPGRSSLLTRDVFTLDDVKTEGLHENDPEAAAQQVKDSYIKGLEVHRPAVISVNMFAASLAVNDFLARLHPYRSLDNREIASIEFSLGGVRLTIDEEMEPCLVMGRYLGYGDRQPVLGLPELGE